VQNIQAPDVLLPVVRATTQQLTGPTDHFRVSCCSFVGSDCSSRVLDGVPCSTSCSLTVGQCAVEQGWAHTFFRCTARGLQSTQRAAVYTRSLNECLA
jgi:hypothetical protein